MPSTLSIIILAQNRPALLRRAVLSVLERFSQSTDWELLLVLNGASQEVALQAKQLSHPRLRIITLDGLLPGAARNHAVTQARGEILFFLDDDVQVFGDLSFALFDIFSNPNILVAGGPNLTPPNSPFLARASGQVMASFSGAAFMSARYSLVGQARIAGEESLILCNLAMRRSLFKENGFPTQFLCGEENVFLLKLPTGQFWWDPRLAVYHQRRSTWAALARQAFAYGQGRARGFAFVPMVRAPLFLLPSAFVVYLMVAFYFPVPLAVYAAINCVGASCRLLETGDFVASLVQLILTPWVHIFYGIGFMKEMLDKGVLSWLNKKWLFR
jgi:succinoglycan biosynthesis protein ExoA